MYNQIFTTQIAIQGQTSILIANLTNIEHQPVVGDILYGSDAYYAQITRVGESVVEFTVIGEIPTVVGPEGPQGPKGDTGAVGPSVPVINVLTSTSINEALSANQGKVLNDTKANKTQEAWITPTLLNGATNFSNDYNSASYIKDQFGFVRLKGLINVSSGGWGGRFMELPVGYRPLKYTRLATTQGNNVANIIISPSGECWKSDFASLTELSLDGLSFPTN